MELNTIAPVVKKKSSKRVGRGIGSGNGKTSGRGHKGQKSRSGGYHKVGFEGGQMPLQRRLPKRGFTSRLSKNSAELRLHELAIPSEDIIDMDVLKKLNLVPKSTNKVKVILSGELKKSVTIKGLNVTKGALSAIEAAGGKVEN